jgi:hypothetical protein
MRQRLLVPAIAILAFGVPAISAPAPAARLRGRAGPEPGRNRRAVLDGAPP